MQKSAVALDLFCCLRVGLSFTSSESFGRSRNFFTIAEREKFENRRAGGLNRLRLAVAASNPWEALDTVTTSYARLSRADA
jgi:hypothetical protein